MNGIGRFERHMNKSILLQYIFGGIDVHRNQLRYIHLICRLLETF